MLSTPLDPTYEFQINIRPIKIAYFVLETDEQSLIRAIQISCTQWGGMYNLIIPIRASDLSIASFNRELLKLHKPEWFVLYSDDEKYRTELQNYLGNLFPERKIEIYLGKNFEENDNSAHALGVIAENYLQRHLLVLPKIKEVDEYLLSLVLFGAIYPNQEASYRDTVITRVQEISLESPEFLTSQCLLDTFSSPLNLTNYGIQPTDVDGGFVSNHFDIVIADSLSDICFFWNLRSTRESSLFNRVLGRRVLILPKYFAKRKDLLNSFFSTVLEKLPVRGIQTNRHVIFCAWDTSTVDIWEPILSELSCLEKFQDGTIKITHSLGSLTDEPSKNEDVSKLTYRFEKPSFAYSFKQGFSPRITIISPLKNNQNQFIYQPPIDFRNHSGGRVIRDVQSPLWNRFPVSKEIAHNLILDSWFSPYGLSTIVILGSYPHQLRVNINIPDEWSCVSLFFKEAGFQINVTKVSQYSDSLVELVEGLQNIEIVAKKSAYILLDFLSIKSTKKLAQRITNKLGLKDDSIEDIQPLLVDSEVISELKGISKTYKGLSSEQKLKPYRGELLDLLQQLCEFNVLKRGFYLECPKCGTPDWYSIDTAGEKLTCSGCSHKFTLPAKVSNSELEVHYRANTLVNRIMDQDALPAILATYYLTKDQKCSCIGFGISLRNDETEITDFDFLFVKEQKLYGGECKTGDRLEEKDMRNAKIAAQIGFSKFYFCTLRSGFDTNSVNKISELEGSLAEQNFTMTIEILSGQELLGEPIP